MKVGDLVDFEFDKTYMGLIIEESDTKVKNTWESPRDIEVVNENR